MPSESFSARLAIDGGGEFEEVVDSEPFFIEEEGVEFVPHFAAIDGYIDDGSGEEFGVEDVGKLEHPRVVSESGAFFEVDSDEEVPQRCTEGDIYRFTLKAFSFVTVLVAL